MQTDPTNLDLLDEDALATAEQRAFLRQRAIDDFTWLMSAPQGRRLVWGWLADAGTFRQPFAQVREVTDFNCGLKNMGLQLWAKIMEHTPEAFAQMLKEQKNG